MTVNRRAFLKIAAGATAAAGTSAYLLRGKARALYADWFLPHVGSPIPNPVGHEVLYNGIVLPTPWPPYRQNLEREPEFPPYLQKPPAVIPIDVGRQLFVDDFLVEECELDRAHHAAEYIAANPTFTPTAPWETYDERSDRLHEPRRPVAMPFSDGVWFDPADRLFKMWYQAGYGGVSCYAESDDGIAWRRPMLDVVPGTNIVFDERRDSTTVWLDHDEPNPRLRFKMMAYLESGQRLRRYCSADGIHWTPAGFGGASGDRSTFFYNPFRKVWVYSLRDDEAHHRYVGRHRRYHESRDFCSLMPWTDENTVGWVAADQFDRPRVDMGVAPEIYNLDGVAYESVLLGLFTMYFGDPDRRHKPNCIYAGYSRDGFHWSRPSRDPFIGVSERPGDWNWTNVQSAGGCCLVMGDRLYFYVSGRSGIEGTGSAGVCSTGIATLRRDGFASLDDPPDSLPPRAGAPAPRARSVTTRPVRFSGAHLFVNAAVAGGELRVEVLDSVGGVVPPFSAENCAAVREDRTRARIEWRGASLADLAGESIRFRFLVRRGRLYAFWVAPDETGASRGYVAAGGPGFRTPIDTEGSTNG